jgi:long-subunit acyl-CoA synthetase (AMP-forming)
VIASGLMKLNLVPEVMNYEDRPWRFLGIKSKNRKEWYLTHIANMLIGVTTVAMYDSLTPDAEKFIIN